ncbi:hypothetical protein [Glycomyces sp. NPDC047010]|uniref:hypothetical protein n=1 Tax=Glycomyces sp. NPDC047010 TaxID=3155023 RepID=UPI0033CCF216
MSIGLALAAVAAVYLVVRGTDDGASNDATNDAGTTGATCIDDAAHVIDEKAGLCFTLPEGWTRLSEEEMAEQEFEVPTSVVSSPGGEARMLVFAWDADEDVLPEDEVAVSINAFVDAGGTDAPEIEPMSGTVDGYPSATASGSHDILGWFSTTSIRVEDRIITTRSMMLGQEPELKAQIEAIQESFSLT